MKRILILSYYFPPCNGAPADRPNSWYKYFYENNIFPVILTRSWKGDENAWEDYIKESEVKETETIESENGKLIYLPYKLSFFTKIWIKQISKTPILSTFVTFIASLFNNTNLEFSFNQFYKKALGISKDQKIDAILVTLPPHSLLKTGIKLSKKLKLPLIVDYRDLWDNDVLNPLAKPNFKKNISNKLIECNLKKKANKISLISLVSPSFAKYFSEHLEIKTPLITQLNGFDEELFDKNLYSSPPKTNNFTIALFGAFYPKKQDMSILFEGIRLFIDKFSKNNNIKIVFYGIKGQLDAVKIIEQYFEKKMNYVEIHSRIPRKEAAQKMQESTILIYSGWQNYKGIYSTKIFDYIASGRKILIAPGDKDVIDTLVLKSKQGVIANTKEEVFNYLEIFYFEWTKKGCVANMHIDGFASEYSRKYQNKTFSKEINKVLIPKK